MAGTSTQAAGRPGDRHLDCHPVDERPVGLPRPHGCMDRERNGGMGRIRRLLPQNRWSAHGGRFIPTSTVGAPLARRNHTAVWSGGLMVVWGGSSPGDLNTGGRDDPATVAWTSTGTQGARRLARPIQPSGREV